MKERTILNNNIVQMKMLKTREVSRKRQKIVWSIWTMKLDDVIRTLMMMVMMMWVRVVASPTEFVESLLELRKGSNDLVCRKVNKNSWSCTWCCGSGCSWLSCFWFHLEWFSCWVGYEPHYAFFVEYPHTRHCLICFDFSCFSVGLFHGFALYDAVCDLCMCVILGNENSIEVPNERRATGKRIKILLILHFSK